MTDPRIVVLASGDGSNLQALLDAAQAGGVQGRIVAVVSDRSDAGALQRASAAGVESFVVTAHHGEARDDYDERLVDLLASLRPDLLVLAGWMRILTEVVVTRFRVINLHPALPGELPGTRAIERAWHEFGAGLRTRSGVMVHEVPDAAVDDGPVLASEEVRLLEDDDLQSFTERMHAVEHRLLVEVVADICARLRSSEHEEVEHV